MKINVGNEQLKQKGLIQKAPTLFLLICNTLLMLILASIGTAGASSDPKSGVIGVLINMPYYTLVLSCFVSFCGILFVIGLSNSFKILYLAPASSLLYFVFMGVKHFLLSWNGFFGFFLSCWFIWGLGILMAISIYILDDKNQ